MEDNNANVAEQTENNPPATEEIDNGTLIIYENPEKLNKRRLWEHESAPYNSSRICLSAMPGCGKRNLILNIVNRLQPKPKVIHVVHCDPNTIEYDCLGELGIPIYIYTPEDFPTLSNIIEPEQKESESDSDSADPTDASETPEQADETESSEDAEDTVLLEKNEEKDGRCSVVIVDECPADALGKVGNHRMERLINHISTHYDTLVICSIQNLINMAPAVRRGFNHHCLWKQSDAHANQYAATRAGIPIQMLTDMFELCKSKHDFIWIDLDNHADSQWRYRLNMLYPIYLSQ